MKSESLAPLVLFVYNRPELTKKLINSLKKNKLSIKSKLFIFSDAPKSKNDIKKVEAVRRFIKGIKGFKDIKIVLRDKNYGLANNIIDGVTKIINKYKKIIVLEEDLIVNNNFLDYMNSGLDFYKKNKKVFCLTGYNYPKNSFKIPLNYPHFVFLLERPCSWAWATWKNRWDLFQAKDEYYNSFLNKKSNQTKFNYTGVDLSEKLFSQLRGNSDSWAIKWTYTLFENKGYCVYPKKSFVKNIGINGVHSNKENIKRFIHHKLKNNIKFYFSDNLALNLTIKKAHLKLFNNSKETKLISLLRKSRVLSYLLDKTESKRYQKGFLSKILVKLKDSLYFIFNKVVNFKLK